MISKRIQFFNRWAASCHDPWPESGGPQSPVVPWITHEVHPEIREFLDRFGVQKTFAEGEPIIPEYTNPTNLVLLQSGLSARVFGQTLNTMALSTPYRIASGNLNFFSGRACFGRYCAVTACSATFVSQDLLLKVLQSNSRLFSIFSIQCELINLSDRIAFGIYPLLKVEERLAALYISWAATYGRMVREAGDPEPWIAMPDILTRQTMKAVLSTSQLSVDKILRDWSDRGVWQHVGFCVRVRPSLLTPVWLWISRMAGFDNERTAEKTLLSHIEARGGIGPALGGC